MFAELIYYFVVTGRRGNYGSAPGKWYSYNNQQHRNKRKINKDITGMPQSLLGILLYLDGRFLVNICDKTFF